MLPLRRKIAGYCHGYATTAASIKPIALRSQRRLARSQGKTTLSGSSPRTFPLKTTKWNRPLAPGVLPAYDQALAYIMQDSNHLKEQIVQLELMMDKEQDERILRELSSKVEALRVESEINLPSSRWSARNGVGLYPKKHHCIHARLTRFGSG